MKNSLCIVFLISCVAVLGAEKKVAEVEVVEPGYQIEENTRDPFVKYVAPASKEQKANPDGEAAEENTNQFSSNIKVLGTMMGRGDQIFGIFSFGALAVGKSKTVSWGEESVEVTLLFLDVVTMKAKLKIGKDTINVTKDGGTK